MKYTIREFNQNDAELLFSWRNDPVIYLKSSGKKPVTLDEHTKWFNEMLNSDKSQIFIMECDRKPIGQIRYNRNEDDSLKLSIFLIPEFQHQGIGSELLLDSFTLLKQHDKPIKIVAEVLVENTPSHLFFQKHSFTLDTTFINKSIIRYVKII
ncbi:GNAT family N-acetyltransferase [Legionella sp. PATHC032]|uniref:GNAT family N-acetyltransferase n=1 Tax=Legionella sp. PATHC032 TaxID=2992039 RepID=UPI001B1DB68E|nr:GNAT family N-acetyltransferase [Legionella sp. PATHC032]MCW8420771.1 GNAT family N-acetyltransferase [Legionella sp. PATHC032]HAZ7574660.1 GNAT family N-acetyltransferase [Legionella pneumophila]HBA1636625.1 GNAT family N-acetyltransferase [Legionella pneumophila]